MTGEVVVLTLRDRDRWVAEHGDDGLPSQSWHFASALTASGFDPKLAIVRCGTARMLVPFFERSFLGTTDVATLPGLSGASLTGPAKGLLETWSDFARSQRWVAGYLQLALLVEIDELPAGTCMVPHNAAFMFSLDRARPHLSRSVLRKVADARRLDARMVDDRATLLEAMIRLYPQAMRRLGGTEEFSAETLRLWANTPQALLRGVSIDGAIEAVHLGHVHGSHCEWHLAATSEQGRSLATLIYMDMIQTLPARGVTRYNVGGGGRVGDGLYRFKERLGGTPMPMRSLRQVYDPDVYATLCAQAGVAEQEWFPAYHRRARRPSAYAS